jgi:hypothetical protein
MLGVVHLLEPVGSFLCECGSASCDARLALTAREYARHDLALAAACKLSERPLSSLDGGADWGAGLGRRPPHF